MPETASHLKNRWMKMPDSDFDPLTFGELTVDQQFIGLPLPGDNSGHGGFRGAQWIFTKTHQRITEAGPGLPYGIPHGRAVNDTRGLSSDFPNSMLVVRVQ